MSTDAKQQAEMVFSSLVLNELRSIRQNIYSRVLDPPKRNIDEECGYPSGRISGQEYRAMYEREGIGKRIVHLFPDHCWAREPDIYEKMEPEETEWEKALRKLVTEKQLFYYLHRLDLISGIGRYGVLLFGLDDGKTLDKPVSGFRKDGSFDEEVVNDYDVTYLRVFDETVCNILEIESDVTSPRYGLPNYYELKFQDPNTGVEEGLGGGISAMRVGKESLTPTKVHWSRVIHVAENCINSEIYGEPRMKPVWNRLLDLRKILGGSSEMLWKGGFPGYSLESQPDVVGAAVEIDIPSIREEIKAMAEGLQRYIATQGMTVKSLAPQVADPRFHFEVQIKAISITLDVPMRKLVGSEAAALASVQDERTWNIRIAQRNARYVEPKIIRPVVSRLMNYGTLPRAESYIIEWDDLNAPSDLDKAEIASKFTDALVKYCTGGVEAIFPPKQYFTSVLGVEEREADMIIKLAEQQNADESFTDFEGVRAQDAEMEMLKEKGRQAQQSGPASGRQQRNSMRAKVGTAAKATV